MHYSPLRSTQLLSRSASALSLTLALLACPLAAAQDMPVQNSGVTAATAATPAAPTSAWPQTATQGSDTITIYEPQFVSLSGVTLTMSAGVSITRNGSTAAPENGIAALAGIASSGDVPGEIEVNSIAVSSVTFGSATDESAMQLLRTALSGLAFTVDRETLVEDMAISNARGSSTPGLSFTLPRFVSSTVPTVLIAVDGAPILTPAGSSGWNQVKNTPFVVLVSPTNQWFVWLGDRSATNAWMSASSMTGDFATAEAPPADVIAALGTPTNTPKVPTTPAPTRAAPTTAPTRIVIATTPTVLIATNGAAKLSLITTGVSEVTNANCVLLHTATPNEWWTLHAGRWFHAAPGSSWAYADPSAIPSSFASLPATGRMKSARASVPGTVEANSAVVAAREVRTVTVNMDVKCTVTYNGDANFTSVGVGSDSAVGYATNASQPVFGVANQYFCCDAGAWFVATDPSGPWTVTDSVPAAIYDIPATCPDYPATYVEVYGSEKDPSTGALTSVTFGFTAGYLGTYLNGGTPVYGTGYDYASAQTSTATAANYQASPSTYGTDSSYDNQSGTYAPSIANSDYDYMQPAVQPYYLDNGWCGWGWCPSWTSGWGWGWNNYDAWGNWNQWYNNWNPYWNPSWNNQWQHDQRLYQNGRGENARNGAAANSSWGESSNWKNWNSHQTGFPESNDWKNWNSHQTGYPESADWQKWNAADKAGDEPQDQRPADQPADLNRNQDFYNGTDASRGNDAWGGQTSRNPAEPGGNQCGSAIPRMGTSGFHPSYNQNYRPSTGSRPAAPAYHGGGGRR